MGNSLEAPRRGGSNVYPQSVFRAKIRKNIDIFQLKIFSFYNLKNLCVLHGHVFVMHTLVGSMLKLIVIKQKASLVQTTF